MRSLFCFLLLLLTISCSKSKIPEDIIPPEKMQDIFWDYIRADILTTEIIQKDSTKNTLHENLFLQRKVFAIHNVTKEHFYKSYDYYSKHPDLMKVMMDSMMVKQNRNQIKPVIKDTKAL